MYYDIHYTNIAHGLQFIIFDNHTAPDDLIVLPFYYLYQTPLTFLIFQVMLFAVTGLVIFLISRDLLKRDSWALFMCFAFFINPGVSGMMLVGTTVEMFIPLFFVLTFYYYMKGKRWPFYLSSALLLATQEASVFIAGALGIGLFLYAYFNKKDGIARRERMRLALTLIAFAIVALMLYNLVYYELTSGYQAGYYPGLPPLMGAGSYPLIPIFGTPANSSVAFGKGLSLVSLQNNNSRIEMGIGLALLGLAIAFLGFGIGSLPELLLLVVFLAPWLVEIFVSRHFNFFSTYDHYYGMVIGATFAASLLGMQKWQGSKSILGIKVDWARFERIVVPLGLVLTIAIFVISIVTLPMIFTLLTNSQSFFYSTMLFSPTPAESIAVAQLNSAVAHVPQNASVLTQDFIMLHLLNREYDGVVFAPGQNFFTPQYVLLDFNANITGTTTGSFSVNESLPYSNFMENIENNYTRNSNYTLYFQNGTALLYKRISAK
jgi:uncharacterized membrane protein